MAGAGRRPPYLSGEVGRDTSLAATLGETTGSSPYNTSIGKVYFSLLHKIIVNERKTRGLTLDELCVLS